MIYLVEFDASGQEVRLMAEYSQDETMLQLFRNAGDFHSYTGSQISGIEYDEFIQRKKDKDPLIVAPQGLRYCGKFVGLSMQYRISAKSARIKARVDYGIDRPLTTIAAWQKAYHRAYSGVKRYWTSAIRKAREQGFAETLAGRRFKLTHWSEEFSWKTSSSAINFPIQGSGADMKELAMLVLRKRHPEFEFAFDLHDGLFYRLESEEPEAQIAAAQRTLNTLPYAQAWGWTPSIPFPWDASYGLNWGEMRELK